ncbi:hypothetical protein EDD86DRAFT_205796 [Gorgonomyces haynaldii]|nr:hypothetical protein EDD86DRAFT_205796 [Gorgonomyces haynaldii]
MTFGKIYTYPNNPRVHKALIAAEYNGLDVDEEHIQFGTDNKNDAFLAKFPLGKVPAFEGADGFTLYESSAITYYVAAAKEGTTLLGKNVKENALVHQWIAFADNELAPIQAAWLYPIIGFGQFNEAATEKAKENFKKAADVLNKHLLTKTYLVGETITLADITVGVALVAFYKLVLEPSFIAPYVNLNRWFNTLVNQPNFKAVLGEVEQTKKMIVADGNPHPLPVGVPTKKKVAKKAEPKQEKKQEKKPEPKKEKPAPKDDLEELAEAEKAAPKEKNPLDLLPKSSFILDEWKRFYSNNDTRPTAIDWFWSKYDPEGYSIWKVQYKYNDELTQIFMSSNLVGGFFQRLDRARKYAFGSVLVLGEDGKNEITGVFVFRGHDIPFEVRDAADFESYEFTRLDDKNQKHREFYNAIIAWDDKVEGKPCADGKVFK